MRQLKCHRCGSAELVLHEAHLEWAEYDGGLFINEQGRIQAEGEGYAAAGEIQPRLTEIGCQGCGHRWRPRRSFTGAGGAAC